MSVFTEVDSVSGTIESGSGVGRTFNGNCTTLQPVAAFTDDTNGSIYQATTQSQFCGSAANGVTNNFKSLYTSQKQDILNFLRSL